MTPEASLDRMGSNTRFIPSHASASMPARPTSIAMMAQKRKTAPLGRRLRRAAIRLLAEEEWEEALLPAIVTGAIRALVVPVALGARGLARLGRCGRHDRR